VEEKNIGKCAGKKVVWNFITVSQEGQITLFKKPFEKKI